uniref:Photosystem II reaction center protein Z n=1 Tax=Dichotomosiphon tuberosus TaxID=118263 RepID=A0A386AX01_9CHLO|nr:photosystem II protein Z [Dichotomosiphon tuberosus]
MNLLFQISLWSFIVLSFLLTIGVPVILVYPGGWLTNKKTVFSGVGLWFISVFTIGILNSFVI